MSLCPVPDVSCSTTSLTGKVTLSPNRPLKILISSDPSWMFRIYSSPYPSCCNFFQRSFYLHRSPSKRRIGAFPSVVLKFDSPVRYKPALHDFNFPVELQTHFIAIHAEIHVLLFGHFNVGRFVNVPSASTRDLGNCDRLRQSGLFSSFASLFFRQSRYCFLT